MKDEMKRRLRRLETVFIFSLVPALFFPQGKQYEIDYIKGDIQKKTDSLKTAAQYEDYGMILNAIDYALSVKNTLGDDADLNRFVETAVQSLKPSQSISAEDVSAKLGKVFTEFNSERIQIVTLDKLKNFPSSSNTVLVNNFVNEKIQSGLPMDNVTIKAVQTMKYIGNNTSFNILFIADVLDIWPGYSSQLEDSFDTLINSCEREVLQIQAGATAAQKLKILAILANDTEVSVKIRGEVAENMLSVAINTMGELKDVDEEQINIQLSALQMLSDTQWTRSASLITDYFPFAQKEYESGLLKEDEFCGVIQKVSSFSSTGTVQVLSRYLDVLNKGMEQGNAPVKAVVLSVINSLGALGDKTAFDYLLYVTYLEYPDDVVIAARNALSKLKW